MFYLGDLDITFKKGRKRGSKNKKKKISNSKKTKENIRLGLRGWTNINTLSREARGWINILRNPRIIIKNND